MSPFAVFLIKVPYYYTQYFAGCSRARQKLTFTGHFVGFYSLPLPFSSFREPS